MTTDTDTAPSAEARAGAPAHDLRRSLHAAAVAAAVFAALAATSGIGRVPLFTGRAAALLVLGALGAGAFIRQLRGRDPLTVATAAALAAAAVATVTSDNPSLALWGPMNRGFGLIGWMVAASGLAAIRSLDERGRRAAAAATLAGIAANAAVAAAQAQFDLPSVYATMHGAAHGLTGDPASLGVIAAAGAAAALGWAARARTAPRTGALIAIAGLCAFAAVVSQSVPAQVAAGIGIVLGLYGMWGKARRALCAITSVAAGVAAGLWGPLDSGTFPHPSVRGQLHIWEVALRGWWDRPLTGWGPGRFAAGTLPHRSAEMAVHSPDGATDAHNIVLEALTTTGVVGVVAMLAVGYVVVRSARGPAGAGALLLGAALLTIPVTVPVVVALVALTGLATPAASAPTRHAIGIRATVALAQVAMVIAAGLVVAVDIWQQHAFETGENSAADRSIRFGPPWPELHDQGIRNAAFVGLEGDLDAQADAVARAEARVEVDPADATHRVEAANLHLQWGDVDRALVHYQAAVAHDPWFVPALQGIFHWDLAHGDAPYPLAEEACTAAEQLDGITCRPTLDAARTNPG